MATRDPSLSERAAPDSMVDVRTELEIQDVIAGGRHTLRLSGELDLATAPLLQDAIERIGKLAPNGITLDLSDVSFVDSSGIRAVLELHTRCRHQRIELRIIPGAPAAQHIFEVTGLLDVLPFATDGA